MLNFSKLSRIYFINNIKSIRNCKLLTPLSLDMSRNEVQTLTTFTREKDSDSKHKRNRHTGVAGLFISIAGFYALNSFTTIEAKENEEKNENEFIGVDTGRVSEIYEKEIEAKNTKEIGRLNQRERYNFIANVVETTAPAVVYIEIKDSRRQDFFGGTQAFSNGSGFIIKEDGLILTNAHVVIGRPHSIVQVKLQDGRVFSGQVEAVDTASDLATVRIPCNNLPTLKLGSSSSVKPGEFVVAMGSPLSLANTITSGVVSSVNRGSSELGLRGRDMEYIQTDAAITFGNSGGPLVNLDGEAIGINAMKVTAGISFAIPIDYAKEFLLTLEKQKERGTGWLGSWMGHGKDAKDQRRQAPGITKRRYMGVTLLTLTPQLILELQMRGTDLPPDVSHGVLVWKVVIGSPAHSAGLTPGDVIVTINGRAVVTAKDIYKQLEGPDETLQLGVVRKRQHVTLTVRPEGSS